MVELIVGSRGSGKTKRLIEAAIQAEEKSAGNVVCLEKGRALNADLNHKIRLIDTDEYQIDGADAYHGFIAGILAANYDITNVFCDATYRILCGEDKKDQLLLEDFIISIEKLGKLHNCTITFSISANESDIPAGLTHFIV